MSSTPNASPEVMFQNEEGYPVDEDSLREAVTTVLAMHDALDAGLSIVITTNEAVQELNLQYRDIDAPTDVLSFSAEQLPPELADDEGRYLGDLVIAYPYASQQAVRLKHPVRESFMLLVVHGTLHLLGYDHDTLENRAIMWDAQEKALNTLGIDTRIVPTLEEDHHV